MSHIWKSSNQWGCLQLAFCERCQITRSSMFYSNFPGGKIGNSTELRSIEKHPEPDCDSIIVQRVMRS